MVDILRKVLFPVFVLIYLVLCPVIILKAFGVVFTPRAPQSLTKTGLISLATFPANAIVELGGRVWPERTPVIINSLPPGKFQVKISLPGYRTWEHDLDVKASKATSLENIILLPESWPIEEITAQPFDKLLPLDGNPFFLLKKGGLLGGLYIHRWPGGLESALLPARREDEENKLTPLLSTASPYLNAEVVSIDTIPQSPYILIHARLDSTDKYFWVDPIGEKTKVNDLTDLFNKNETEALWDAQRNTDLFTREGAGLTRLSIDERAIFPKVCREMHGYGLANKKIYGLSDSAVRVLDYEGKDLQSFEHTAGLLTVLQNSQTFYKIHPFTDNIFALWGDNGELLMTRPPYLIAAKGVLGLRPNPKSKQLFFWDHNRIGMISFIPHDEKELTADMTLSWPVEKARRIEQVYLVNDGSHLLYRDGNTLFLVDLNPNLGFPAEELFKVKRNSDIRYADRSGRIFFMDEKNGAVYAAALHSTASNRLNKTAQKENR